MPDPPRETAAIHWGFLGAGKMATALVRGMIGAAAATTANIVASDPIAGARAALAGETGVSTTASNAEVARRSNVLVLAVKPQHVAPVLAELEPLLTADHLLISIAAGVTLDALANGLGPHVRLVRVMPNTPALLGAGAAGYCLGPNATVDDETTVLACVGSVGRAFRVPEDLLDAVTGLSGSGPAFVYVMIEALADGGVRMGLPRDIATALAAQTMLGGARMVLETGLHTGLLKDQVASPGGTTIAGLHALERGGLRAALIDAVEAATRRSIELAAVASRGERGREPARARATQVDP
jgi:pyrroline-5-carboxylate reductase